MSKPTTKHCVDCAHADCRGDYTQPLVCTKGHKPRFYMIRDPLDTDWGWKRRCEDFKEGIPLGIQREAPNGIKL